MRLNSIDTIVKGELLRHNLSIHYYIQRAYLALRFLRTINFDSAFFIKTITVPIINGKVAIPPDFVGLVRIGVANGSYLKELAPDDNLITYDGAVSSTPEENSSGSYYYPNTNKYGENLGGYFGYSHVSQDSYKIIYEENQILINNGVYANAPATVDLSWDTAATIMTLASTDVYDTDGGELLLQYTTDGMSKGVPYEADTSDLAVYVHPYGVDAMISYIDWKIASEGNRFVSRELRGDYYNELRKYRARINPLTGLMIKRSLRKHYGASIKN